MQHAAWHTVWLHWAASQIALCHKRLRSVSACLGPPGRRDDRQRASAGVRKQNWPAGGYQWRRTEGSLRSWWPSDRKGAHNTAIQREDSSYWLLLFLQGPRPQRALTAALCYLVIDREAFHWRSWTLARWRSSCVVCWGNKATGKVSDGYRNTSIDTTRSAQPEGARRPCVNLSRFHAVLLKMFKPFCQDLQVCMQTFFFLKKVVHVDHSCCVRHQCESWPRCPSCNMSVHALWRKVDVVHFSGCYLFWKTPTASGEFKRKQVIHRSSPGDHWHRLENCEYAKN